MRTRFPIRCALSPARRFPLISRWRLRLIYLYLGARLGKHQKYNIEDSDNFDRRLSGTARWNLFVAVFCRCARPSLNRRNYVTRIAGEQRERRMKREVQKHLSLGVLHLASERTCSFFRFIEGDVFQHGCLRPPFLIHTVRNQMQSRRSVAVR